MLNFRQIDNKFCLSGGWTDVPKDAAWLNQNSFRAVLDVQFSRDSYSPIAADFIREQLADQGIEYYAIPMNDGENPNIENIFEVAFNTLTDWDEKYTQRKDKILVKCGVGTSRSVAILIHFYCIRDRLVYSEAQAKIRQVETLFPGEMPISIEPTLEIFLKTMFPNPSISSFGEME